MIVDDNDLLESGHKPRSDAKPYGTRFSIYETITADAVGHRSGVDQDRLEGQTITQALRNSLSAIRYDFRTVLCADAEVAGKYILTRGHCGICRHFNMDREPQVVSKWHVLHEAIREIRPASEAQA